MDDLTRKIPTHEVTYAQLRDMILFGVLEPGQPVTIQGLIQDLGAGMTPVREAIRRLTAEGALLPQGNRRVAVPKLTAGTLDELAFVRLAIEPRMAGLACGQATPEFIARLEALDDAVTEAIRDGDIPAYLQSNHEFHFALYEASGAPILLDIARGLWLRFGPSLRAVCARVGSAELPDRHLEALAALRAGDAAGVASAIERDIAQGVDQIRAALEAGEI